MNHTGWDFWRFNCRLGWVEMARSIDYFRFYEFPQVLAQARLKPSMDVLDMGCGKSLFPLFVASHVDLNLHITDIDEECLAWQRAKCHLLGLDKGTRVRVERADSTQLPYAANAFDRCINLGSIEHIPEDGDTLTMRETARVLRPGGMAVLSIPYSPNGYEENQSASHWLGFERRYDEEALLERLIRPSGLRVLSIQYFGEKGFPFSRCWYPLPFPLKLPLRGLMGAASSLFLNTNLESERHLACGVQLVLQKPRQEV